MQWTSNNLNNTSERIVLSNAAGAVVDSVRYFDTGNGWNPRADGEGYSLELCRESANNSIGDYWKISNNNTNISIEGKTFFGSPGKKNNVACSDYTVTVSDFKFSPADIEINVGEYVEWQRTSGTHNINGTTTTFPNNPESFGNGAPSSSNWTYLKQFNIPGVYKYQCDPHANAMKGTVTVKPKSSKYPSYSIAKVTSNNVNGEADSLNVNCQIEGVVYGVNLRPPGVQITIIDDNNDGIAVFSGTKNYGYSVKEGDRITVQGRISQFQGMTQILPDTILKVSANNNLFTPTITSSLNEATESQLVKINGLSLVNQAEWSKNPLGFTVSVTDGTNTFDVRIDNDVNLVNMDPPTGTFSVTGLGSQFDASTPFNSGYQLMPRYSADIFPYNPGSNAYRKASIGDVTENNANGLPDSLGRRYELRGVVHGIDINGGNGLQFTIIDQTGGIGVFHGVKSFGYIVKEGDDVSVFGSIDQFRGLTQINIDTLILRSANNNLVPSRIVNQLDESTESELIELLNLKFVDVTEWKSNGSSFNVRATNGTKEFLIRIDDNCELSTMTPQSNAFSIKGIGSQFDDSEPYLDGYQILPRYAKDIQWITATKEEDKSNPTIKQNPIQNLLVLLGEISHYNNYYIINASGQIIQSGLLLNNEINFIHQSGFYFIQLVGKDKSITLKFLKG